MLTVLTTSTGLGLTVVADVKEVLHECDNKDDALLAKFIGRASARLDAYCGRSFLAQKYQEVIPAFGGVVLQLAQYPIRTMFRVFDGTDTGSAIELSATGYRVDRALGQLNRDEGWAWTYQQGSSISFEPLPGQEYKNWLVEYSAGFVPAAGWTSTWEGSTSTGTDMPMDVQDACIQQVQEMYLKKGRDANVQSEKVGELSITYTQRAPGQSGLSEDVVDLLAPYRSIF